MRGKLLEKQREITQAYVPKDESEKMAVATILEQLDEAEANQKMMSALLEKAAAAEGDEKHRLTDEAIEKREEGDKYRESAEEAMKDLMDLTDWDLCIG